MIAFSGAVQEFLESRSADGLKPATLCWYESRLAGAVDHFQGQALDRIGVAGLRRYVNGLYARTVRYQDAPQRKAIPGGLSLHTIHGHLRALRTFFKWCADEYHLPADPMKRIQLPRLANDQPKAATLDDLERLLGAATGTTATRDRAILLFLADTGCRAGGLLSLTLGNLDLRKRRALLHEKGEKYRTVCFTDTTATAISLWLASRPTSAEDYLFCVLTPGRRGSPLTLGGLHSMIHRLAKRAGVTGRVNPHAFRHMFGCLWQGDAKTLSILMGHSDVATTLRYYVRPDMDEISAKHGQFSPVRSLHE